MFNLHVHIKGSKDELSKLGCTSVLKDCLYHRNHADHDEMPHFVSFHLGLHCLLKYTYLSGFQIRVRN